jgi:hypothetical protein
MVVVIHWLSSVVFPVCLVSLAGGAVIFVRNLLRKDPEYEVRFPWWKRLSLYLVAFVIPPIGLLGSLWLYTVGKSRERVKFARGFLLVSLIPFVFCAVIYLDPNSRVIIDTKSMIDSATHQQK